MYLNVTEVTKKKTTKCPNNFYCLSGWEITMCDKNRHMCKAVRCLRYNGLIVIPSSENGCPYRSVIDSSTFCNCPTRIEIFFKYRK